MKPVTSADVARFVAGHVTDDEELDRIMDAISNQPELEDLFFLLSDDTGGSNEAEIEDSPEIDAARNRIALLRTARLCLLAGVWKTTQLEDEVSRPLHLDGDAAAGCSFAKSNTESGSFRLKVKLPAGRVALNLVAAEFSWNASDDLTRIRVHRDWNRRPLITAAGIQGECTNAESRSVATTLAADSLPAAAGLTQHFGETFFLNVAGESPRAASLQCLNRSAVLPLPVLVSGTTASGETIREARLLRTATDQLTDLFGKKDADVTWLEVRPLPLEQLSLLNPSEATELLSHQKFAVRALTPVAGSPEEYDVKLSDESIASLLDNPNVSLCLSVADARVETEVQR